MSTKPNTINLTFLCIIFICIMMLSSCGVSDWIYELPNGYSIWEINCNDIALIKEVDKSSRTALSRYILEFCYNNSYIGIKRISIDENIPYPEVQIDKLDKSHPDYYLVDTTADFILGPYTAEEYYIQIETLEIGDMCDWIKTVPKPNGAIT